MTDSNPTPWRKSTYSGSQADCVEVGTDARHIMIRDTANRNGGTLIIPAEAWRAFLHAL